jgi:hypothetical protein
MPSVSHPSLSRVRVHVTKCVRAQQPCALRSPLLPSLHLRLTSLTCTSIYAHTHTHTHTLQADPTLYCVSAWNDNGVPKAKLRLDEDRLYRTGYFPGLGWMLSSKIWNEVLRARWPSAPTTGWDHWIRLSTSVDRRECISPEVPRTRHVSTHGTNVNSAASVAQFAAYSFSSRAGAPAASAPWNDFGRFGDSRGLLFPAYKQQVQLQVDAARYVGAIQDFHYHTEPGSYILAYRLEVSSRGARARVRACAYACSMLRVHGCAYIVCVARRHIIACSPYVLGSTRSILCILLSHHHPLLHIKGLQKVVRAARPMGRAAAGVAPWHGRAPLRGRENLIHCRTSVERLPAVSASRVQGGWDDRGRREPRAVVHRGLHGTGGNLFGPPATVRELLRGDATEL